MLTMAVQPSINGTTLPCPFPIVSNKPSFPTSICSLPKIRRNFSGKIHVAAAAELAPSETISEVSDEEPQVKKVVVESEVRPRLVLKFIWMEKNIGLGLDQIIPGHGAVPLSPYFLWPRKDAWEELKTTLESKPWISQKKMIILLNQATDIINLWQQSGGNLS